MYTELRHCYMHKCFNTSKSQIHLKGLILFDQLRQRCPRQRMSSEQDLNLKLGLQAVMDSVEFVETPQPDSNRIRCTHCGETTVYFHAGECEHKPIVCSTCYEQSGIKTCRDCEQAVQDACREDSQILDSVAYCRLKKDGCDAVLPLRNILHHEDECHPSVIPVNQVANNTAKRMDSAGSLKQQTKEDDGDLRKLFEDLRRKFSEYEKGRVVEKLTNQLALMEEKLNREVAAKKDMERRLLDQTKRKTEVIKQELLRHITDQLSQQVDRQVKESEIKVQGQTAAGLEKLKQDVIKTITAQVSKQVERQVQESSRKITEQLEPKTAAEMRRMARNVTERMGQSLERQLMDSERKILEKVSKKADAHKKELSKNICEQVSQQTEKKMRMTEAGRKAEPTKVVKDNKSLQVEKKTNENNATKEVRKSRKMSSDSNHDEDKTVHRAEDATDGRRREQFTKLSKELEAKVHSQGLEARNNVMAKLQETSRDLERSLLEQVAQAAEKHSQGIQKRCEALVAEQVRKGMADVKDLVAKGVELELGRQAAELQKASAKELKAQRQQLEQANQQLADHLSGAQAGAAAEMRKAAEKDREDLQRMAEAKTALLVKNHAAELQKRMLEELKALRQEVTAAGQKHVAQLQDSHDTKIKVLEKKNEADRDRLQRAVDERLAQQAKVSETELHKRIVKELGLQKLEMARENQQLVAQLHDDQGAALRHLKQQADVDKEKWTKYLEERLGQQVNAGLGALARQATLDKQELLQTYMQLAGLQEARPGKRSEAFKQGLVADVSNQMLEKLDKRMTALQQEMDTTKAREEITRYVDQKVQDAQEELQQVVQSAVKGIELFEKDPAGAAGNTAVDGAVSNGPAAHEREDFKRAIISEIESNLLEKLQGAMNGRCERCSPDKVSAVNGAVINGPTALEQEDFKKAIISEIENNVLDKLQGATNGRCDRCSFEPARGGDDGHVNGKDDGPVQNSAANGDHGEQGRSLQDMSHFEHFEAMQRKIFNKQFGKLVNEAHAKIMAVVNELSVPKREEMVTEVALRVNERLEDIQKILLNRLDQEILMQKQEVLRCLEERLGQAMKQNSAGDAEPDTQTTFMKEWHEENSRLIPMPQGHLVSSVDHKEEIRRLVREEMAPECSVAGPSDGATTYVWRITNFSKRFEAIEAGQDRQLASNEFTVQGTPLKLKVHLMRAQMAHWLSLVMGFVRAEGAEGPQTRSMHSHRRTFVLVDQSQAARRMDRVVVREPGFRDEGVDRWMARFYGPVCFAPLEALREGSPYVKNDAVIIKIVLEPSTALYRGMRNEDGVLYWKIEDYAAKKQAEVEGLVECLYSDYFATGPKGYRMQVRAYLNGDAQSRARHLSLYLYFRRGQHDEFIAASFPHKVTFTVMEQAEGQRRDISKTMENSGHILSAYGFREFAAQEEIEAPEYLCNDTLLVKVEVAPLTEPAMASSGGNSFLYG